jgi:hypothetical protein
MQSLCKHAFPTIQKLRFLPGSYKVVIKNSSEKLGEFRDASLPGYKLRRGGIKLSWQLQNNSKK